MKYSVKRVIIMRLLEYILQEDTILAFLLHFICSLIALYFLFFWWNILSISVWKCFSVYEEITLKSKSDVQKIKMSPM